MFSHQFLEKGLFAQVKERIRLDQLQSEPDIYGDGELIPCRKGHRVGREHASSKEMASAALIPPCGA